MALDQQKHPIQYRAPHGGGPCPLVFMLHGDFGLGGDIAARMRRFAEEISTLGHLVAVPRDHPDDRSHGDVDPSHFVPIFAEAVAEACARPDAASGSIGILGYSLGAGVALLWMTGAGAGRAGVFVDFFGFAPPALPTGLALPPTAIFHNRKDGVARPARTTTNSTARRALAPGGVLAVWSAAPDPAFSKRLSRCGFDAGTHTVRAGRSKSGARCRIWIAVRTGGR